MRRVFGCGLGRESLKRFASLAPVAAIALASLSGCGDIMKKSSESLEAAAASSEIAPSGTLHVAINLGNPVLARREGGELAGVSVDLARALAAELVVPLTLTPYPSAGKVVAAAASKEWDIAFVARDPVRAEGFYQSAPYVLIYGSYLVSKYSTFQHGSDVDQPGVRVVVGRGSAYDLYLTRELKHATIVRIETSAGVVDAWQKGQGDVAAGVTQQLIADQARFPETRLLPEPFMTIEQAIALPLGRPGAEHYLEGFVRRQITSGAIAADLARSGIKGAEVAKARSPA